MKYKMLNMVSLHFSREHNGVGGVPVSLTIMKASNINWALTLSLSCWLDNITPYNPILLCFHHRV